MSSSLQHPRRLAAAAARWRLAPPAQARSRETVDRFAQAAEELLRERPFEEIGVQDIARHAGRPGGAEPGSGLGLAIAQGLATANGATLTLEPAAGPGATLTVSIPAAPAPELRPR